MCMIPRDPISAVSYVQSFSLICEDEPYLNSVIDDLLAWNTSVTFTCKQEQPTHQLVVPQSASVRANL
jgi:hypothetical protein